MPDRYLLCACGNVLTVLYQCRYVMDVYMPRDKVHRTEHRGFGFVTFETEAAVHRVAVHGSHTIKYVSWFSAVSPAV